MPELVAILPIKSFDDAKQRLREAFDPTTRRVLAEAMFSDVLIALRRSALIDLVLVVSRDHGAQRIAAGYGAMVLEDDELGHNAAAMKGVQRAIELGARRALLVPGDCPMLDPSELDRAGGAAGGRSLGSDRARPPRNGNQRAAAVASRRAGARRSGPAAADATRPAPAPRVSRFRRWISRAWRSTSTRPRISPRWSRRWRSATAVPPTPAGCCGSCREHKVTASAITAVALEGLPEIRRGDDLAELIAAAMPSGAPDAGDVLVLAHKVVSKAEGRTRTLSSVVPSRSVPSSWPASSTRTLAMSRWCSTSHRRSAARRTGC